MIPYNQVSFLGNSESGKFNSYLGLMDINKHHVSSCLNEEYIEDGSKFVAVSVHDTGRETTIFHVSISELDDIRQLSEEESDEINRCEVCEGGDSNGASLHASTFGKSATFHGDTELCSDCIEEFESSLNLDGRTLESEVVQRSI